MEVTRYDIDTILSFQDKNKENPFMIEIQIIRQNIVIERDNRNRNNRNNRNKYNKYKNDNNNKTWSRAPPPEVLKRGKNAWKREDNINEDETKIRKIKSIFNKLSLDNFNILTKDLLSIKIDTQNLMENIVKEIFNKAVLEPHFGEVYAKICVCFGNFNVNFKKQLIIQCQTEFERTDCYKLIDQENEQIQNDTNIDPKEKKIKLMDLKYKRKDIKIRMIGNVIFIGQLHRTKMISEKIIHKCFLKLFQDLNEDNIECICKLFETVGSCLRANLDNYFTILEELSKDKKAIATRYRFMTLDIIELRTNRWIPRRVKEKVKTKKEIRQEDFTPKNQKVKWGSVTYLK